MTSIRYVVLAALVSGCGMSVASLNEVPFEDYVEAEGEPLSLANARLIRVPNSDQTLAVWDERGAFALKHGARNFGPAKRTRFELVFPDGALDPRSTTIAAESSTLQLVQFYGPALPQFLEALAAQGAKAVHPFPHNAYVMRLDANALAFARSAAFVRAVVPFEARRKVSLLGLKADAARRYLIMPADPRPETLGALLAHLTAIGAEVDKATVGHFTLHATLDPAQLEQVGTWEEVLNVDPYLAPEADVDKAREISGANFIQTTLGFSGQGVRAEVMDGNVDDTHPDLASRGILFHGPHSGDASHGTPTTGIVFGGGVSNPAARGLMPSGQPIFADYDNFNGVGDRYAHTNELKQTPYQAVLQSNSWGSGLTTAYTSESAEMDRIIFDLDFLIFNSQSNTGNQSSRPQAWAKNIVSIGGVKHQDTLDTADDRWANGGSIGPASDGRIKPDLAHFWDLTLAPAQGGGYTQFGGTSGATPITAGLAGLAFQMWSTGLFNNNPSGATVFDNRPHFTTAKALLINTATQWDFTGATHDLTRTHQGWGRVDLKTLYERRNSMLIVNETELLTQSTSRTYSVAVGAAAPELRATLTWADPPALPSAGVHRVNDLTLKVVAPNGTVFFGNVGLKDGLVSTSGGAPNSIDTVENVFVRNPAQGVWTIEVRADEVAADGHVETPEVDVDFALVVSGITPVANNALPTVSLTAPASGSTVSGVVTLSATAADADGSVSRVRFGLPSGAFVDDSSAPFGTTFDTTTVANGSAQFSATAFDDRGASSLVAQITVSVNNATNQAPTVTLGSFTGPQSGVITVIATPADPDGSVARVDFTLPDGSTQARTSAPWQLSVDTRLYANGSYTLRAVATDDAGATSAPATTPLTISNLAANQPPSVTLSPFTGAQSGVIAVLAAPLDADGTIARVDFTLPDGSTQSRTLAPWQLSLDTRLYPNGTYTLRAVATDNQGAASTPASTPLTISNTATGPVTENFSGSVAIGATRSFGPFAVVPGSSFRAAMTGTGDPDLYVRFGAAPTSTLYSCRPYLNGAAETCTLTVPANATTAYVNVVGYAAGTFALAVTYTKGTVQPPPTGTPRTFTTSGSVTRGQLAQVAPLTVVPGSTLTVTMTGTSDPDLYVRFVGAPTLATYDCRPYTSSASETCTLTVPATATQFFIGVNGFSAATYSITANYLGP